MTESYRAPGRQSRRRFLMGAAALGAGGLLLPACLPSQTAPQTAPAGRPGASGTPVPAPVAINTDAAVTLAVSRALVLDTSAWFMHQALMCWEPLIDIDARLEPVPALATSWQQSEDGLSWLFTLKRGVAFTDGTPFNGAAVARNIERMYQVSPRGGFFTLNAPQQWGPVAGVDVLDDHTVRVRHSSPFPVLDRTAAGFFSAMFSPQSFQPNGDFAGIPSTTGPFRFVDWERDQWYRVVRNEGFQGTAPRVREVLWRLIPDANSRVAALQARQVDGIVELGAISVAQAEDLKRRPDVVVGAEPIALTQWIFFNTAKPPFDDKRLRQAVARWLDRTAMVRDLSFGYGVTDTGVLSSLSARWFSPRGVFQRNPQQAQALAQAALGGRRVEVDLPYVATPGNSRSHKETVDYLGAVLAPLGLDVKPRPLENAAMTAAQTRGEFNLRLQNGFGWVSGDPDQRFRSTLHSRGTAQATWGGGYNNPEADALIDRAVTLRDLDARKAIYDDLQALSVEEAPFVVIYDEISPYAHAPHIIDLGLLPNYRPTVEQMAVAVRA